MPSEKRKIGDIGEDIACRFLMKQGFSIIERNYLKRWGEIDIVAQKDSTTYFFEVKTMSSDVTMGLRPEDNIHAGKLKRLEKVIETYIAHKGIKGKYQCDLLTVILDFETKEAQVKRIECIL